MALTVQNLRAVGTGVEPASLLPGQLAFNITDKVIYVGDGSSFKTNFDGTQVAGTPGEGWYAMPMDFDSLGDYYVANPGYYGDVPTDQQVLAWSTALNHPIWISGGGGGGGSQVYVVTNAQVALAPGATTSDKISAAIGVVSPDEGNVTIVTGIPDDVYEGLYFFTTSWVKGAAYAYPSASEVIYNNVAHPTLGATVQFAIDDLDDGLIATTAIANTANSTANSALVLGSAALPRTGGTMTGPLTTQNIYVPSGYGVIFSNGSDGTIEGISDSVSTVDPVIAASATSVKTAYDLAAAALARSGGTMTGDITFQNSAEGVVFNGGSSILAASDSVSTTSSTTAASSTAVKTAYDLAAAATPRSSYTATGDILYGTGSGTFTDLAIGTPGQVLIVGPGNTPIWASDTPGDVTGVNATFPITVDNTDPQQPTIGINGASTVAPGAVQLSDSVSSTSSLDASTPFATKTAYDAGIQGQADAAAAQATADAAVPRASYAADGDILVGTGAGIFGALGVGTQGQILVVGPGNSVQWEDDAPGDVTGVTGTAPITVNNADPENPVVGVDLATTATPGVVQVELTGNINLVSGVINVPDGSTTVKGAVQLNNTLSSSSTTEALTAAQGAALQNQIDTLTLSNSVILAGGYDATTGLVDGVTSQGTLAGFVDMSAPPAASATNVDHYLICIVAGTNPSAMQNGDWLLSVETSPGVYAYQVLGVGARPASATYTQAGIVQLANAAAVLAGTSDTLAITPQALQDNVLDSVTTANSNQIASSTAAKTAYDAGIQGQTDAAAAQVTANAALPKAGGTMTGTITAQNVNVQSTYSLQFAGGVSGSLNAVTDLTNVTSSTTAASATAVKSAYDLANTANTTANAALPRAGGTMTGTLNTLNVCLGTGNNISFNGGASGTIRGISDATGNTNDDIAASSTAVKNAYALADAAVPKACYTALGALTAGTGASTVGTLALGSNGQFLAANNGCSTGIEWCTISIACVPCSAFTAAGQLLAGTGTSTFTALNVGSNNQVLVADSACTGGLKWLTSPGTFLCGYTCSATPFNTALGTLAGDSITTGSCNTVFGYNAGTAITGGLNNTFVGFEAGDGITSADSNVAVGSRALSNTGGNLNTAVGYCTGGGLTSGGSNTFIGGIAGYRATTLDCAVAVGYGAMGGVATGTGQVAVGANALGAMTSGAGNTAVGFNAGAAVTTGGSNTLVGYQAGDVLTTGAQNTAIGVSSLGTNVSGTSNVAVGSSSLQSSTSSQNTAIGNGAGCSVTTGTGHVYVGYLAGSTSASSCNNTAVGWGAGLLTTGACNTFIGNSSGSAVTTGSCNTLVGRYTGTTALSNNVVLSDGAGTIRFQANSSGAISFDGTNFGTSGQTLQSNGSAAVPTWVTPQTVSTTATKAVTNATPVNLLSWASGVRLGDLTVMATDNSTNVVWANVTIASLSGIGSSVVVTQAGTFGTFAIIAGGSGETIVQFTPSATLATVNFVYKYTVSFGTQPTVL